MNVLLFTVYDEKAQVFTTPFFVATVGIATRAFSDAINSPDHQFGKHPQDYTLFKLGTFDDNTAELKSETKQSIGNGVEFVNPEPLTPSEGPPDAPPNPPVQPN